MEKKNLIPMVLAVFIAAVGLMFLGAVLIDLPPLEIKSPENYVLAGGAVFFIFFGCVYGYLLATDNLADKRRTITEVRQEAVEKIKDESLLARVATEDPDEEVREAAQERLQEISS
jgi:arginine exporter protein ArgO